MSLYLGDFVANSTVVFSFTTNASDGARASFSATLEEADIVIFKDGTAMTLDAATITITSEPGSRVGVHLISVDMSNDADFTTGSDYIAVLYASDETVDSKAPAATLAHWSCLNRTVDVGRINGDANAAQQLGRSAGTIVDGAAIAGTLSTVQMSTNLTEVTDGHYNGRIIIWTAGPLLNQATDITGYDGTSKILTYTGVTEPPVAGNTFIIV